MTKSSQGKVLCKARSFDHDDVDANFDLAFDVSLSSFHGSDQYQSATLEVNTKHSPIDFFHNSHLIR